MAGEQQPPPASSSSVASAPAQAPAEKTSAGAGTGEGAATAAGGAGGLLKRVEALVRSPTLADYPTQLQPDSPHPTAASSAPWGK
jgi:hypothetical protein